MFHDGDLNSAITASFSQDKFLTCFIYKEGDEQSAAWELLLTSNGGWLEQKTVVVKFTSTSQEASYLRTFHPVEDRLGIVVIRLGKVVDEIKPPLSEEDLVSRLQTALGSGTTARITTEQTSTRAQSTPIDVPTSTPVPSAATSEPLQSHFPNRAARLEADQAEKQAQEKAERIARAEARRQEVESGKQPKGKETADARELGKQEARSDWIRQQAKNKEASKRDRERILQQIESDKQERKHRASVRPEPPAQSQLLESSKPKKSFADACALQVRLLDGSSVRGRFAPSDTLAKHVRAWLKESAPAETLPAAYTFRLVRSPQPSRNIEQTDEETTLAELELLPSAALIVVASAVPPSVATAGAGAVSAVAANVYSVFAYISARLIAVLNHYLGLNASAQDIQDTAEGGRHQESTATSSGVDGGSVKLRTQTLAGSRARDARNDERTEFYNGNSSAFEGRKDDDDDET